MNELSITYILEDIATAAKSIVDAAGAQKIFIFHGEMGAGKTTLIKALCREMGVVDNISSPTFSIVNEYSIPKRKIYHFDFYRLKNQAEAMDMGCEEYFYSGECCFIEWPEMIPDLLPKKHVDIRIDILSNSSRKIMLTIF